MAAVSSARLVFDRSFDPSSPLLELSPDQANLHTIHATESCAFIDVTIPSYNEERPCTYYRAFSVDAPSNTLKADLNVVGASPPPAVPAPAKDMGLTLEERAGHLDPRSRENCDQIKGEPMALASTELCGHCSATKRDDILWSGLVRTCSLQRVFSSLFSHIHMSPPSSPSLAHYNISMPRAPLLSPAKNDDSPRSSTQGIRPTAALSCRPSGATCGLCSLRRGLGPCDADVHLIRAVDIVFDVEAFPYTGPHLALM